MKHPYYGWILVIISACVLMTASFGMFAFGVFVIPLATDFGWGRGAISGAISVSTLMIGPISIIAGRLNDRHGPRILVTVSGLFTGIGFLLLSRINSLWQWYLVNMLVRGFGGSFYPPVMTTIPRWFTKKRGIATGIATAGFGLGGVISPIIAQWIISAYDWRQSFVFLGLVTIVTVIPLAQFLRHSPQRVGLKPYGEDVAAENYERLASIGRSYSFKEAIKAKRFWLYGLILMCYYTTLQAVLVHVTPLTIDAGIPVMTAASMISVIAGTSIIGRLSMGFIAEKVGTLLSLLLSLVMAVLALTWLLFSETSWTFYIFAVIFGLSYGSVVTLETLITAELFGLSSLSIIYGGIVFFTAVGIALGAPLAGIIFDVTGSYDISLLTCISIVTLASILSLILLRFRIN